MTHPTVVYTVLAGLFFLSNTGQYYTVGTVYAQDVQLTFDHQDYPLGAAYEETNFTGKGVVLYPGCQNFGHSTTIASYLFLPDIDARCWFHEEPNCPIASDKGPIPLWDKDIHLSHKSTQGKNVARSAYCWRPKLRYSNSSTFPVGVVFEDQEYSGVSEIIGADACNTFKTPVLIAGVLSYLLLPHIGATCEFHNTSTCAPGKPLWTAKDKSEHKMAKDHDNKAKSVYCVRDKQ